jgi:hypothetical protein
MATTTAVLRIRPRVGASLSANRRTAANFDVSVRYLSGVYSATSIPASANLKNALSWLPSIRVPLTDSNGCMSPEWYRFMNYLCTTVLGGPTGSTVADIATAVVTNSASAAQATQAAVSLTQQADANAQAMAAVVQVVQTAALPGASQIPPIQLTNKGYQR